MGKKKSRNVFERFFTGSMCRHNQSMGSPCELDKDGYCSIDAGGCDTYSEKGEAYRAEFEDDGEFEG